jgi:hypothetical protein
VFCNLRSLNKALGKKYNFTIVSKAFRAAATKTTLLARRRV